MSPSQEDLDTELRGAVFQRRHSEVRRLLAAGADPNACNEMKWSALHIAAHLNLLRTAFLLIRHGADASLREQHGCMPVDLAFERGHDDMVLLLAKTKKIQAHVSRLRARADDAAKTTQEQRQKKYKVVVNKKFRI